MGAANLRGGIDIPLTVSHIRFLGRPERFILLSAARLAEHGNGGAGGVFSGSWVKCPKGRLTLAGPSPPTTGEPVISHQSISSWISGCQHLVKWNLIAEHFVNAA